MTDTTTITSEPTTRGFGVAPGDGERLWIVGDTMTLKATAATTGGTLTLIENLTSPGGGPPPHTHETEDEFWYVIDGEFEVHVDGEVHRLGPGGVAFAPAGAVHFFRNVADTPSRVLVGFTPGGIEGFFRAAGRPAIDDGPAPPFDDAELARTMEAAPRYGLTPVFD